MKKLRWKKIKYKTLLLKETTTMWSTYFFKDNKKHKKSFEVWDFKVPSRYIRTLLSLGWNIRNFLRVSFLHFWSSENYSWNIRSFLKYKEFFRGSLFLKDKKSFLLRKYRKFFRGFHFLKYKKFSRGALFSFFELGLKCAGFHLKFHFVKYMEFF